MPKPTITSQLLGGLDPAEEQRRIRNSRIRWAVIIIVVAALIGLGIHYTPPIPY